MQTFIHANRKGILQFFSLLLTLTMSIIAFSQSSPADCKTGCTSSDVKIITAYLSDDKGDQLSSSFVCPGSGKADVYLTLELTTKTPRIGVVIYLNIKEFSPVPAPNGTIGEQVITFAECFSKALNQPTNKVTFSQKFIWDCGTPIVLTDVFIGWGTGNTNFCTGSEFQCPATSSKCYSLPPGQYIPIVTPSANETSATLCSTDPGGTTANFNLTSLENDVKGLQTNVTLSWFADIDLITPIGSGNPIMYNSTTADVYCKVTSNTPPNPYSVSKVTLTVVPSSAGGTAAAANSPICEGSGTNITLSGSTGTIQKWQYSTNGTDWTDIASTANPLNTGNLSQTTQFRAVVKSGNCATANSTPATVNVDPASNGGTASAAASPICAGTGTSISLTGATGVLQKWQYATNSSWTDINSTDNPLNTGNLTITTKYRAVVKSGVCDAVNSNEVTVTVNAKPANPSASITVTPTCSSASGTVVVNSPLDVTEIDYEYKLNNGNWTDDVSFAVNAGNNFTIYVRNKAGQCEADGQATGTMDAQPGAVPAAKALITQDVSCSSSTGKVRIVQDPGNQAYDPQVYEFSNNGTTYGSSDEFTFTAGGGFDLWVRRKADITCVTSVGCDSENPAAAVNRNTQNDLQESRTITQHIEMPGSDPTIKAFPNPFSDRIRFVVNTPEAGTGSLEVHNMLGQKVKTVYQGNFTPGTQSFDMQVPNSQQSTLIYVLRLNGKQVSGKILQVKD